MKSKMILAVLCVTALVLAQEPKPPIARRGAPKPATPATAVAKKGDVRRSITRKGTFVPAEGSAIKIELKGYKSRGLKFTFVAPHGSFVNEGDVIARFDHEDYDRKLLEAKMALEAADLGHRQGEMRQRMATAQSMERLAKAEIDAARAAKRLEGYRKFEKPMSDESQELTRKSRGYRLDDQRDELEQLEKMYSEDELVDATEEIVLKRSRRNFARSVAANELSERRVVYNKKYYDLWRGEDYERAARDKAAALDRARRSASMARDKAQIDAKQAAYRLKRQHEKFKDLAADGSKLVVRAPRRGIVLHGSLSGPWMTRHKKDSKVAPGQTFLSVAGPKKYKVKTDVAEADLLKLKANTAAEITPSVASDMKLAGRLEVEYLPRKPGLFPAHVPLGDSSVRLRPGLTCKVELILAEERGVIVVPLAAVKRAGDKATVRLGDGKGGPFHEVEVVTGIDDGKRIAIRDGVKEGDVVAIGQ